MTFILQAVDTDDQTILWDFQDPTGTNNPYGVRTDFGLDGTFTLSPPAMDAVQFSSDDIDGFRALRSRARAREAAWPQRVAADDYDSLVNGIGELAAIFRRGGTLRWQPEGAAESRWLDFAPSPAPAILNGQRADLRYAVLMFDTVQGVPLSVQCQPYLRGPLLDSATNLLKNSLLLRDSNANGRPDDWAWTSTAGISGEAIDPDEQAYTFDAATTSDRDFAQATPPATAAPGDIWTFAFYAKLVGGATDARMRAVAQFESNTGTPLGSEELGTLTTLTSAWQRLTVTTSAAPASTDRLLCSIRMSNSAITSTTIGIRWAQAEVGNGSMFVPGAQLMSTDSVTTSNGITIPIWVHGNAWAPVAITLRSPNSGAKVQEYLVARRSTNGENAVKQVVGYLNGASNTLQNQTLYDDTASVSDANASNGNAAEVSSSLTDPTVAKRRVRLGFAINTGSMRGSWDVYLRAKPMATAVWGVQLRWAAAVLDPLPNANAEVTIDSTLASSHDYVLAYLGRIAVPYDFDDLSGVAMEVWARRISGSGALHLDDLRWVPIDDPDPCTTRIIAPSGSEEQWQFDQLASPPKKLSAGDPTWTAGNVRTNDKVLRMNAVTEACGTPPAANTGLSWSPARNVVTFNFGAGTNDGVYDMMARVVNITDDVTVVSTGTIAIAGDDTLSDQTLQFDSASGKKYQAQAMIITTHTSGHLDVESISHASIPYLGQQDAIYADPETGMVASVDSSGDFRLRLNSRGPVPLWCPPGLTVMYVHAIDIPIVGYNLGESVLGRTWSASVTYAPRYWA